MPIYNVMLDHPLMITVEAEDFDEAHKKALEDIVVSITEQDTREEVFPISLEAEELEALAKAEDAPRSLVQKVRRALGIEAEANRIAA